MVKPAEPAARPRPRDEPVAQVVGNPGDVFCSNCGAPNPPSRTFCIRCGAELRGAAAPAAGPSVAHVAGSRPTAPQRRGFPVALVVIVAVAVALGATAWFGRELIGTTVAQIVDRVQGAEAVNPTSVAASSSAAGRDAALAHDGVVNQSWAPAAAGEDVGEYLDFTFDEPFRLVYLQIRGGAGETSDVFLAEGRPAVMTATLTLEDGSTVEKRVALADEPGIQQFEIGQDGVEAVRLTIDSSRGTSETTGVAVAEVEFRGR